MAKENINPFFDTAMTDKTLAAKLAALAGENGYDFTAEELLELGAARPLSDGEVAGAAGGDFYDDWLRDFDIERMKVHMNKKG